MPIEDLNYSTLTNIIRKVRRIISSASSSQITDADITHYINDFVLYGFPEDIKLFNLKKTLTFYTSKNIDIYETNLTDPNEPLYNFYNRYTFCGEPIYVNGIRSVFMQDRSQFYALYPSIMSTNTIGTGDGITTNFTGILSSVPVMRNNVIFSSVDNNGSSLQVWDDGNGLLYGDVAFPGTIDYVTGAYNLTFTLAPAVTESVSSKTVYYTASIPRTVLFYDKQFIVRPIPDDVYAINVEVYKRPDELLSTAQMPELAQHWKYIAYGAALEIFADRRDNDSRMEKMQRYQELEQEVRAKATMQLSQQKASTIYDNKSYYGNNNFPFGWRY